MRPKDADGIANNVDPDQTAPKEQSDLGLHCLLSSIFPNTRKNTYVNVIEQTRFLYRSGVEFPFICNNQKICDLSRVYLQVVLFFAMSSVRQAQSRKVSHAKELTDADKSAFILLPKF